MIRNNKKGFTLVELLAVIAVLGLVLIVAIPKVMDVLNTQKKRTLELTTRSIIKAAEEKYLENTSYGIDEEITCEGISNITSSDFDTCKITFDKNGNATVTLNGKGRYEDLACKGTKQGITCQKGPILNGLNCTFNDELKPGKEFIHNQYTYRYKEEYAIDMENLTGDFVSLNSDGWSVRLTDLNSTEEVNTPVCTYINGKPVVSTAFMFAKFQDGNPVSSKATSIDVSSWDTSNVTNMMGMFVGVTGDEIKGISSLKTDKVTNMYGMFQGSAATILDLSSFDTSNVTDMTNMFENAKATIGYARTQADADRFNASSNKPATLIFVVK